MSKLFNALEKIRHHEARPASAAKLGAKKKRPAPRNGPKGLFWGLLLLGGILLLSAAVFSHRPRLATLYANLKELVRREWPVSLPGGQKQPAAGKTALPAGTLPATPDDPAPSASLELPARERMVALNNKGAAAVRQGDYWRGIYYFDQARELRPQSPEPLINMAVALSELGLPGPALKLWQQAYALAPQHPMLRENLRILAGLGMLEGPLYDEIKKN